LPRSGQKKPNVVLAGRTRSRTSLRLLLELGLNASEIPSRAALFDRLHNNLVVDLLIIGPPLVLPGQEIDLLCAVRQLNPTARVILIVERSSEFLTLAAFRAGAADYLTEPVSDDDLVSSVRRVLPEARVGQPGPAVSSTLIGESQAMRDVRTYVDKVAQTDSNVLVTGETGVGKELVSELIHSRSARGGKPCVSINCAAIPDTLLESELFGFERGAFTGADFSRDGTLKSADGGSVFFDEVGDMGLAAQAKILRAIEAREVHRLGGRSKVPIDIRIIAATNQDLERLVGDGKFRKDLFYRLNVARVHLPPLRERPEDLEPLLQFYLGQFNRRFGRRVEGFTSDALECLRRHSWPGNVREVKNLLEAVFVGLNGHRIHFVDLPEPFRRSLDQHASLSVDERQRLISTLFATNWNKSKAAQELHWSRMTLYRKLAKYQLLQTQPPTR